MGHTTAERRQTLGQLLIAVAFPVLNLNYFSASVREANASHAPFKPSAPYVGVILGDVRGAISGSHMTPRGARTSRAAARQPGVEIKRRSGGLLRISTCLAFLNGGVQSCAEAQRIVCDSGGSKA